MARKTSFYYSFLVLPRGPAARDHRRLGFLPRGGRCGGRRGRAAGRCRRARRWCSGATSWRAATAARRRRRRRAAGSSRSSPSSICRGRRSRTSSTAWRWISITTRYETFDDLFEYCRRVASAVGMICIRIFGCQSPRAADYALHLGVALQLTNILRDVKGDLEQGRVYLPLEDLRAAGCTDRGSGARAWSRIRSASCSRSSASAPASFTSRAIAARPPEDRRRLVAAEIMRAVYFETLQRIERSGYDVFSTRDARAEAGAGGDCAAAMAVAVMSQNSYDVIVVGAGFAGLERGRPADAPTARACCVLEAREPAGRPRHRVSRSRDRRAGRQRPARPARLLSRDVRVPRRYRRQRSRAHPAAARRDDDRSRRRAVAPAIAPGCRRRCILLPACSTGRRCRGRSLVDPADGGAAQDRAAADAPGDSDRLAASPGETVANWLIRNGQTPRVCEMLWEPLALAALNQPPRSPPPPPFARVLAEMFGQRPARRGDRPADPAAAIRCTRSRRAAFIEQHGGLVTTGRPRRS